MKRILIILIACFGLSTAAFSQKEKKVVTQEKKEVAKTMASKPAPGATVAPAVKTTTTTTTTKTKLKKDGTPDMRLKENKDAAKAQKPLKKDGSPDMRYKNNKKS